MDLIYVTGNKSKIEAAKVCMEPLGVNIIQKDIETPEIQADTNAEVACYSSKWASELLKCNTVKNDGGLVIPALNGFTGVYSKYIEKTLDAEGILKLMVDIKDRTAYWIEAWAYTEYGKEPVVFEGRFYGRISTKLQGENGYGYDKIFIPDGMNSTLAEMTTEDKLKYWCSDAHKQLVDYIKNKN